MNHAVHLRFSLTHVHTKNRPFCVYEQNCWESKTCPCDSNQDHLGNIREVLDASGTVSR